MKKSVVALLHTGYWVLYGLLWALVILLVAMTAEIQPGPMMSARFSLFISTFGLLPAVLGFYTYYTWLFDKFLRPRRILGLFLAGIPLAALCGTVSAGIISLLFPDFSFVGNGLGATAAITTVLAIIALLNGGMGLVIRGFITWYQELKLKEMLQQKNFDTEMALIKAQLNPHFLFNTINNIDVLIGKDPTRASQYLNHLSDIMRFMLYETRAERIPLQEELTYIEKYLELQRIRSHNNNYIHYHVEGDAAGRMIPPMLFIPIIENAFKHAEYREKNDAISITLQVLDDGLAFECRNKYRADKLPKNAPGGLGSELISKRLQALFPNNHALDVSKNGDTYCIKLSITQLWTSPAPL